MDWWAVTILVLLILTVVAACIRGWRFWPVLPLAVWFFFVLLFKDGGHVPALWFFNLLLWVPLLFMVITGTRGPDLVKNAWEKMVTDIRDFDLFELCGKLKNKYLTEEERAPWADSDECE